MKKESFNEKVRFPHFLSNSPCCEDLFAGKSHTIIANTIADLLIENKNANIIGIEGNWGSGKSNLIKLVEKVLNEKNHKNFHFFIYDAWGFQNDYQKRSILENLSQNLNNNKIISDKKLTDINPLFSRRTSTSTKIKKYLDPISKTSALFALILPLTNFFYNRSQNENLNNSIWLIIFLSYPIFVFIFQIVDMKKQEQKINPKSVFHELSYLIAFSDKGKNIEETTKLEIVNEEESSTYDFNEWIKKIDDSLKENKKNEAKRLVLVFDNMDRLPTFKVQELWATINTLFANNEKSLNNISVLIPFDREHIKNAFKNEDMDKTTQSYGGDFINKTFNVVFRVSPPIMSDWKNYFNLKWKEAFNEESEYSVVQIYDLLNTEDNTPRKIIAFINEFVSIRKNFPKKKIPDTYVALFLFGKDKINENPNNEIIIPTYLGALDFLYKQDENLPKYISALYYQLEPDVALDVVYTQQIVRALDKNTDDLLRLEKIPTFNELLQNAITKITNVANATLALEKYFPNLKISEENKQHIWNCLYKRISTKETELQDYQIILLKHISNKEADKYLTNILSDFANAEDFDIEKYFTSLRNLQDANIQNLSVKEYFQEKKVEPKEYIEFIELAKDDYEEYKIKCDYDELDNYLKVLPNEKLENMTAMKYLKIDNKDKKFPEYFNSLDSKIAKTPTDKSVIPFLYERLKEIQRPIENLPKDQTIGTLFTNTNPEEDFYSDIICMRLAKLNNFSLPNNPSLFNSVLNNSDKDFVLKIAEKINYYMNFGDLLINIDKMKQYPLYVVVCKEVIENENLGVQKASIIELLKNYSKIKTITQLDSSVILRSFNGWNDYIGEAVEISNVKEIPIEYFEDAKTIDDENYKHCSKVAKEYLNTKTEEDWKKSILDESYDFKLLILIEAKCENCFEAFKSVMIKQAKTEIKNLKKENCSELISLALKNHRKLKTLFNDIRDVFCSGTANMTLPLFNFFGEWLFKYADFDSKKDALRTILPTNILDNEQVIEEILKNKKIVKAMVANSGEESKDFLDKIENLMNGKYLENKEFIDFAKMISLKKKNAEETE